MLSTCFAVEDHNGTTLGFKILNIQAWRLVVSCVWSFGSNLAPKPERNQGVQCLHSQSKDYQGTAVPHSSVAQNGNNPGIADLEKWHIISRTHCTIHPLGQSENWVEGGI